MFFPQEILTTITGNFVNHTCSFTLLYIEAEAITRLMAGAFHLPSFLSVLGGFNPHHAFLLYVPEKHFLEIIVTFVYHSHTQPTKLSLLPAFLIVLCIGFRQ